MKVSGGIVLRSGRGKEAQPVRTSQMMITAAILMMNLNMTLLPMFCQAVDPSKVQDEENEEAGDPDHLMGYEEIECRAEIIIEESNRRGSNVIQHVSIPSDASGSI
jgi:hypothetical protein